MRVTPAEKVAVKILNLMNEMNIDHEQIGRYIARIAPPNLFNSFHVVTNSAMIEREIVEGAQDDTLF